MKNSEFLDTFDLKACKKHAFINSNSIIDLGWFGKTGLFENGKRTARSLTQLCISANNLVLIVVEPRNLESSKN